MHNLSCSPPPPPVTSTRITPELQRYVQRLVNSFGVSLEQSNIQASGVLTQEALTKRAQVAAQDPAFQRLKAQFSSDFELRCVVFPPRVATSCLFAVVVMSVHGLYRIWSSV